MKIWRMKSGADRRIRSGHPWVFSNELSESPKGHPPGEAVLLQDKSGNFLASGYGNPNSLISFRALCFDSTVKNPTDAVFLQKKLLKAWQARYSLGYRASYRLCYGEGDFFPGFVVDRYLISEKGKQFQVLAVQILTAGVSLALPQPGEFFRQVVNESKAHGVSEFSWEDTAVVIRNDVGVRKLEGLDYEKPAIIKALDNVNLSQTQILLHSPVQFSDLVTMTVNLHDGQKTGFFLDQAYNIQVLCQILARREYKQPVRILDLCCYVGQWSTMIAHVLRAKGVEVETTLVDVSTDALIFAEMNTKAQSAKAQSMILDVVQDLPKLADRTYDIVIADPPAFIKAKKDIPTGKHAYLKLNTQAFRLTKSGGLVVSCSCSGLFEEAELIDVIRKSIQRDGREIRCISHGGHAPDHPVLMAFSEGFYLKMFLHSIGADS